MFAIDIGVPDLFEFIDHWPLYVGQENLSRFLTIYEVLRATQHIQGDIVELGSWRGKNLLAIAKVLQFLNPYHSRIIYSFDSFEGLTNPSKQDYFDENLRGKYRGDFEKLKEVIDLYKFTDKIVLVRGMIEETVPQFSNINSTQQLSLIYYDADLFEPAEIMFKYLAPRLSIGGVILLDEYGMDEWPGETESVDNFLLNNINFVGELIVGTKQPTFKITRIS